MFRTADHQADIAVEIEASNKAEFFRSAIEAVIFLLTSSDAADDDQFSDTVEMTGEGYDYEEMTVNLLGELLYVCQVDKFYPLSLKKLMFPDSTVVTAVIRGMYNPAARELSRELKAVTYHNLKIITEPLWKARIVFDV